MFCCETIILLLLLLLLINTQRGSFSQINLFLRYLQTNRSILSTSSKQNKFFGVEVLLVSHQFNSGLYSNWRIVLSGSSCYCRFNKKKKKEKKHFWLLKENLLARSDVYSFNPSFYLFFFI